jgi:RHS repeat-associated protein
VGGAAGGNPESSDPVELATGNKVERVSDIVVPLRGGTFEVTRGYCSSPSLEEGQGLLGSRWTLSIFSMLVPGDSGSLELISPPLKENLVFASTGPGVWKASGPTTQDVHGATITLNSQAVNVWRLSEPGAWYMDFYADGVMQGCLAQEGDIYGHVHTYVYDLFPVLNGDADARTPRLVNVFLNGTSAQNADAEISLSWNVADDDSDAILGKLGSISVYRFDAQRHQTLTHAVAYSYKEDGGNTDLGTSGDLIQVTAYELVDRSPDGFPYRRFISQYRYHGVQSGGPYDDERLNVSGDVHQLKHVIRPEQIEYLAQLKYAGTTPPQTEAVANAAADLLAQPDNATISVAGGAAIAVIDLPAKIVSYGNGKVVTQYLQTSCGCSGGTQGLRQTFDYREYGADLTTCITESSANSSGAFSTYRTINYDMKRYGDGDGIPYVVQYSIQEPTARGGRVWVWHYEYSESSRNLLKAMLPSTTQIYVPAAGSAATYFPNTGAGLVYGWAYGTDPGTESRETESRIANGNIGDVSQFNLLARTTYDTSINGHPYLPVAFERFVKSTTGSPAPAPNDVETTTYAYTFYTNGSIASVKTSVEQELETENGQQSSTGTYESYEMFDGYGQNVWSRSADMVLKQREFDASTGVVTSITENADPVGLNGGGAYGIDASWWQDRHTDGWPLTTTFMHDLLGRTTVRTGPGQVTHYTVRELREDSQRTGIYYYSEAQLPFKLADHCFDGPASIAWLTATDRTERASDFALDRDAPYDPSSGGYTLKTSGSPAGSVELARSTVDYHLSGLVQAKRQWWSFGNMPGGQPEGYATTSYTYDPIGRVNTVTDPNGSVTQYADYDVLGRACTLKMGTNADPTSGDMVVVAEYFFDSEGTATQGMGNGLLTLTRAHTGEGTSGLSADTRDTKRTYDYRGRLQKTENALPPHEFVVYDNLDRVIQRGLFSAVPSGIADLSSRGLYTESLYSQRGLLYKQKVAIDPTQPDPLSFLETNSWFDPEGRTLATWAPNAPLTRREYDALGRVKASYVTDRKGDSPPGVAGSYPTDSTLAGQTVLEQTEYAYGSGLSTPRWPSQLVMTTTRRRLHDAADTDTGLLGASNSVATYVGFYYDDAERRIQTLNFGTNSTSNVFTNDTAPTWPPPSAPAAGFGNSIRSGVEFDDRGLVSAAFEDRGPTGGTPVTIQRTKYVYDAMGRKTATVENWNPSGPPTIVWGLDPVTTRDLRWIVSAGLDPVYPEVNRVTSFLYDNAGNVVRQVAHIPGAGTESVQITRYSYGTTAGAASSATDSLVASHGLLTEVNYPINDGFQSGQPGIGNTAYTVSYSYNAVGELRSVTDQNGTRHTYARDALGRILSDTAAIARGSVIDGRITKIGVDFDLLGRVQKVRSYDASQAVKNAVEFTYTRLWQVWRVFQDYQGDISRTDDTPTANTKAVVYGYANLAPTSGGSGSNYSRMTSLTYPDGTVLNTRYGTTVPVDDRISRPTQLDFGTSDVVVDYARVGLDMFAVVDYAAANVQLDRTFSQDGKRRSPGHSSQASGVYPGWDRYGRVVIQPWLDGSLDNAAGTGYPNRPPIFDEAYQYDRGSNRVSAVDARPGAKIPNRDTMYTYDSLDRLTEARRGVNTTSAVGVGSQKWVLDVLGNWVTTKRELTGNTPDLAYLDPGETEDRAHNAANEITHRYPNGQANTPDLPFAYDNAGNLQSEAISAVQTATYTHDAWNRLVGVASLGASSPSYEYNGLHWRTVKRLPPVISTADGHGNGELRYYYYSAAWQLLEEDVDKDYTGSPGLDQVEKEVWGLRYIDDPVMRWNTPVLSLAPIDPLPLEVAPLYNEEQIQQDLVSVGDIEAEPPVMLLNPRFYHITDVQFSTRAMIGTGWNPTLYERVRYDAYGVGTHRWPGDFNDDGNVDSADSGMLAAALGSRIGDAGYDVALDLNRDGVVNSADQTTFAPWNPRAPLTAGQISNPGGVDNDIGFDGYVFSAEVSCYNPRMRWYEPAMGRWIERDPIGYRDGLSLFLYAKDSPISVRDPSGLLSTPIFQKNNSGANMPSYFRCFANLSGLTPCSRGMCDAILSLAQELNDGMNALHEAASRARTSGAGRNDCQAALLESQANATASDIMTDLDKAWHENRCGDQVYLFSFGSEMHAGKYDKLADMVTQVDRVRAHRSPKGEDWLPFEIAATAVGGELYAGAKMCVRASIRECTTVVVEHWTERSIIGAIEDSQVLIGTPGSYVTRPFVTAGCKTAKEIENLLEIRPGTGEACLRFRVLRSELSVPPKGPLTSGGGWQRCLPSDYRLPEEYFKGCPGK